MEKGYIIKLENKYKFSEDFIKNESGKILFSSHLDAEFYLKSLPEGLNKNYYYLIQEVYCFNPSY